LIPVSAFIEKFGREAELNPFLQKPGAATAELKTMLRAGLCLLVRHLARQCLELRLVPKRLSVAGFV
jgi:hypothetical protein